MLRIPYSFAIAVALVAAAPCIARGQDDTARIVIDTARAAAGWDSPRVLELMRRASVRRTQPQADTALHNYRATAEGFVYFFLDRQATAERTLVRVNQIGLELYWKQPGTARQRIVGMRDASPLPNTMRYHLDHLTMVQNGFGDVIRMGDGDEVRDVIHPASTRGPGVYEYRLADSLELRMQSMPDPIRVYEVQVRPRRTDRPGFVGSVFVDRATADIIRMTFTFTPSSYVDKRLDYINLSLDNGLWDGRYWLPNEQTVEIRRQLPELDFVAGSVIRGRMRILDYQLNAEIPDSIFTNPRPVVAAPPEVLSAHEFESSIFGDLTEAGLEQPAAMAELREEAARLIGRRLMSGLPHLRLYFPDVSSAIRYNRAEGVFLGAGLTYSEGPPWRIDASTGYAFGSDKASGLARVTWSPRAASLALSGYSHALRDLGPVPAMGGIANTVSALLVGRDYLDPWYATGGALSLRNPVGGGYHFDLTAAAERQSSAALVAPNSLFDRPAGFREVRSINRGTDYSLTAALSRLVPTTGVLAWGGSLSVRAARFDQFDGGDIVYDAVTYLRPLITGSAVVRPASHVRELRATFAAATTTADAPRQQHFFLGGVGILPGYPFRALTGPSGAVLRADLTQRVAYPWLGVRAIGAVGGTRDVRTSAGAGLSLFWDLLHIDAIKGLNGGDWSLNVSFTRILDDIS